VKRVPLIITVLLLVGAAGGYIVYDKLTRKTVISAWDLIPAESILVYEGSQCEACVTQLKSLPVLDILKKISFDKPKTDSLKLLESLFFSGRAGHLVSLHATKSDDFDFVSYVPYTQTVDRQLESFISYAQDQKSLQYNEHEYNAVKISEVSVSGKTFSWIRIENVLVGSSTPLLVEDVIRLYKSPSNSFRKELNAAIYQLPKIKNDAGNLYVHLKNFTAWLSLFGKEPSSLLFNQFAHSALLDVKASDDQKLLLNGFSIDSTRTSPFILSAFNGQSPVASTLKGFVSNRVFLLLNFGISDGNSFLNGLNRMVPGYPPRDSLIAESKKLNINWRSAFEKFSGEVSVCWLESDYEKTSKVLILNAHQGIRDIKNSFELFATKLSVDTVFYDTYSNYEIREVPVFRFPEKLFYPLVSGFDTFYYTITGNTLIAAENLIELKSFLNDIDKDETWARSVQYNSFLDGTLLESNVSLYVNTPKVWSVLANNLQPRWKKFIQENKPLLQSLGLGAVQFSHLNNSYYTNVSWSFKKPGSNEIRKRPEQISVNFNASLTSFHLVQNFVDKKDEVFVQDSLKNISIIAHDGTVVWKMPMPDYITGGVQQIDYFNNGKLQYFFATPGMLHVIDRLGNYVGPYPVMIPEKEIQYVAVIDYDNSKKYRFLLSSKNGRLWMYDKEGNNLEGWQPRSVDAGLIAPARHHRILSKDYIVAMRTDGIVYLTNRRGELQRNFPLDLNARPLGDYFLQYGKNPSTTYFVIVSRDGFLIKFNLDGKVVSRETLVKNFADSRFSLVKEINSKSYLIIRQDAKQLTIFNDQLTEILRSDFIGNNPCTVQYLNPGGGRSYIVITDLTQDLSFVYDGKGNLLTPLPVESQSLVVRPSSDNVSLYSYFGAQVTMQPL
jgi:hypothetical protein